MPAEETKDDFSRRALEYSTFYGGKVGTVPKVPVSSLEDFAIWYTPGVAAVSKAIQKNSELSFEMTNRWNTIAVLTDGSRVLGLGDIGPEASLPVMEGKALIYKYLGGVDAIPIPVRAKSEEDIVGIARSLEPGLGGINLEDISSPKCFGVLETLREQMSIPVWHDDQQGTAGVILAALYNALELTGRDLRHSRIVFLGSGAANIAAARLLIAAGAPAGDLVLVDSKGVLQSEREDMDQLQLRNRWKYEIALKTNADKIRGDLKDALDGADVLIAAAAPGPGTVRREDVEGMNQNSIMFLLANPIPEMWPEEARAAGATVIATGRSDFPNQVNNSVLFPAVFRGALDVRAKTISDTMVIAASKELARYAREKGLTETNIIPTMVDWDVFPNVAASIGGQAQEEGLARKKLTRDEMLEKARVAMEKARNTAALLIEGGIIARPFER